MQWSSSNLIKEKVKGKKSCVSRPIHLFLECLVIDSTQLLDKLNGFVGFFILGPMGPPLLCVPMRRSHIHGVKIFFHTMMWI